MTYILCKYPESKEHPILIFRRENNFNTLNQGSAKAPGKPLDLFSTLNHFCYQIVLRSIMQVINFVSNITNVTSMGQRNDTDELSFHLTGGKVHISNDSGDSCSLPESCAKISSYKGKNSLVLDMETP